MKKIIFLDRDGVINIDKSYLYLWENFEFTYRAIDALKLLKKANFDFIIITNQSGIARGFFTEKEYKSLTKKLLNYLKKKDIDILDIFYCPHHPQGKIKEFSIRCDCRKPNPGMLFNAQRKYDLDLGRSFIIGDKPEDMLAGKNAGINNRLLIKSRYFNTSDKMLFTNQIFENLYDCAKSIISN